MRFATAALLCASFLATQCVVQPASRAEAAGQCSGVKRVVFPASASTSDYLGLVDRVLSQTAAGLGPARARFDSALAQLSAAAGADAGALLIAGGKGVAGLYAIAQAAKKLPRDPGVADDLGAALHGAGDLRGAMLALQYANALAPQMPVILANIGNVFLEGGQLDSAQRAYNQIEAISPKFPAAELGLGLIAECRGNHREAQTRLLVASRAEFTDEGSQALDAAQAGLDDAAASSSAAPAASTPMSVPSGGADLGGGSTIVANFRLPPFEQTAEDEAAAHDALAAASDAANQREQEIVQRLTPPGLVEGAAAVNMRQAIEFGKQHLSPGYKKQVYLFDYALAAYDNRKTAFGIEWVDFMLEYTTKLSDINERMLSAGADERRSCGEVVGYVKAQHPRVAAMYHRVEQNLLGALGDFVSIADEQLERIAHPGMNELYNGYAQAEIAAAYMVLTVDNATYSELLAKTFDDCKIALAAKTVEAPPPNRADKKGDCPLGKGIDISVIVVSVHLDCEKFGAKVALAALLELPAYNALSVGYERNFAQHTTTLSLNAGYEAKDPTGMLKGSPGASLFAVIKDGSLYDVGAQAGFGSTLGPPSIPGAENLPSVSSPTIVINSAPGVQASLMTGVTWSSP